MHLYCFISIVGLFRVSIVNNQCRMAAQVCEWCSPGEWLCVCAFSPLCAREGISSTSATLGQSGHGGRCGWNVIFRLMLGVAALSHISFLPAPPDGHWSLVHCLWDCSECMCPCWTKHFAVISHCCTPPNISPSTQPATVLYWNHQRWQIRWWTT